MSGIEEVTHAFAFLGGRRSKRSPPAMAGTATQSPGSRD